MRPAHWMAVLAMHQHSFFLADGIEEEGIITITSLELVSEYAHRKGVDTQIHLHSPIFYETVCQMEVITVIGLESAAKPSLLALIDKDQLES
jgi:hypothetical protein